MTTFENLTKSQKLRASLHRDVQAICKETCHNLGLDITKPSMEVIAELVYKKLSIYALDLEAFAKHAKRSTINSDDVLLLVRRNPSLKAHMSGLISNQPSTSKDKRRKTNVATNVKETPTSTKLKAGIESEKLDKEIVNKEKKDKEKEIENDLKMDNRIKDMSIDGTIDLTFD
ncbi:Centromere protein S [Papilio xuthus]|uniref:Centromere protein S n=1 Tax=Papilio xuthus TaxID=66420 RepID=A0A194Q148_PAPXU|nr:Centromere protein S [Papilio xuthus]